MDGLMMDVPLSLSALLRRAETLFGHKQIVTRRADRTIERRTYAECLPRARRLASGLASLGIKPGDRVATLAWNSHRHLELYWAVPLMGAVLHTLNFRLAPRDLAYIADHAGDSVVFCDASTWPVLESIRAQCPKIRQVIVMRDTPDAPVPAGARE